MKLSRFAIASVSFFFFLFLALLLGGVWIAPSLAKSLISGVTWGHLLFLMIHLLAVVAAWIHIGRESDSKSKDS